MVLVIDLKPTIELYLPCAIFHTIHIMDSEWVWEFDPPNLESFPHVFI